MYRLFLVTLLLVLGSLSLSPASYAQPDPDETLPLPLQTRAANDLLTNASFEIDTDADGIPDGWTGKKTDLKKADKQKCNKPDKVLANTGECAFQFNGNPNGKGSKLQQPLADISAIANGSKITLSAFVNMKSAAPDTKIADLTVKLSDGSKRKLELRLPASRVSGYTKVKNALMVTIPDGVFVSDAVLTLRYGAASGKYLVDDVTLKIIPFTPLAPAILLAANGQANEGYGHATALSADGNTAVVSTPFTTVNGKKRHGSVYVYVRSNGVWAQQQQLISNDGATDDAFGASVSISDNGNTVFIGAVFKPIDGNEDQGAVYAFVRTNGVWTQQQILTATDGKEGDRFGSAISLDADGTTAIIGASGKRIGSNIAQGAAYIFVRKDGIWIQQHQLIAPDGKSNAWFGSSLDLSANGKTALIGAYYHKVNGNRHQGSAYVFVRYNGSWILQQQLAANDSEAGDNFGWAVSLSSDGNTALVGALLDIVDNNRRTGSAYVFVRSGGAWTQQQKLNDNNHTAAWFGLKLSLSADGKKALIGAPNGAGAPHRNGAAYLFTLTDSVWTQQQQFIAPPGAAFDGHEEAGFGWSVDLSKDSSTALIGSNDDDIGENSNQGSAWVFDLR